MLKRTFSWSAALALAGGLFAGAAQAGGVNWSVNIHVPGPAYAEPVHYAPAPVYYAPPPVYYAPPPRVVYRPRPVVVYGPPAVVYHPGRPAIVGGSWERHRDHGPRHWRERRERDRGHHGHGHGRHGW